MKRSSVAAAAAFLTCILAANWAVQRYGLIFGVLAAVPAGTYFAGLTFTLRDAVHEGLGRLAVLGLIVVGAGLSWFISPAFAAASGVAFLVSELADLAVYEPLRKHQWETAVMASGLVGSVVDTWLFLTIAGLPVTALGLAAVVLTKWAMVTLALAVLEIRRKELAPA